MTGDDIIKINKNCRTCQGQICIEKYSENGYRWKVIFCENWCWKKTTDKTPIKQSNTFAEYIHIKGIRYLRTNQTNNLFYEAKLREGVKKGKQFLVVQTSGPGFTEEQLNGNR